MRLPLALLLLIFCAPLYAAVELRIDDLPGEGFNDPSPFTPVDGNAARTLGQARLNALWRALLRYDLRFDFRVPLSVVARMDPLGGTTTAAQLASAGPDNFLYDDTSGILYPVAQANQIARRDLDPGTSDITILFNSDVDGTTVLGSAVWYYGFSGPPANSHDQDFLATALHELLHGLGFITLLGADGSLPMISPGREMPDPYFNQLYDTNSGAFLWSMTASARQPVLTSGSELHFNANGINQQNGGNSVPLYAPSGYQEGSSVSHFDTSLDPDELMEPLATPTWRDDLAMAAMQDMGWTLGTPSATVPPADLWLQLSGTTTNQEQTTFSIVATNNSSATTAKHAYIVAPLPAGISLTAAELEGIPLVCDVSGALLRCPLPDLLPKTPTRLQVSFCSSSAKQATLAINLSSPHADNNPADNQVTYNGTLTICPHASDGGSGGGGPLGWSVFLLAMYAFGHPHLVRLHSSHTHESAHQHR